MSLQLSDVLDKKDEILEIFRRNDAHSVFVFGSVARGESSTQSDLDLVCEIDIQLGLIPVIGMENELTELLGIHVDVCPRYLLKPEILESALKDAIPL